MPLRILVAEDNEFNAQHLEQLLGMRGHRVRLAANGREALDMTDGGGFDLLLLDIHMPEVDGFQVVRVLRERERTAGGHLPVIALTARSREEDRRRCLAEGMDDYLSKPIRSMDLLAAIDRVVHADGASPTAPSTVSGHTSLLDPVVLLAVCGGVAKLLGEMGRNFKSNAPSLLVEVGLRPSGPRCAAVAPSRSQAPRYDHGILHGGRGGCVRPRRPCRSRPARKGPTPGGTTRSDGRGTH